MSLDDRVADPDLPRAGVPREGVEVVPLADAHHGWVARLHVAELPHGLFPRLGRRFVAQWHRAHMASPHGVGYVALHEGRPVGFALGCTDRRANVDWILAHRRARLATSAALALVRRPRLAASFVRTRGVSYVRRFLGRGRPVAPAAVSARGSGPVAVLEAIVVLRELRATGIGSRLVEAFLASTAEAGSDHVELVTKDGDGGAAGFYEHGGWRQVGRHVDKDGDVVLRFSRDPRER